MKDYHLVYTYINEQGDTVDNADWGCQADDLEHAIEQLEECLSGEDCTFISAEHYA